MAEHPRIGRSRRALVGAAAVVVVLAVGLAACGDDPQGEADRGDCGTGAACRDTTPTTTAASVAPVELTFRPVLTFENSNGEACPTGPSAPRDATATMVQCDNGVPVATYSVGPVAVDGSALASARASFDPQTSGWVVNPVFKEGAEGIDAFNAVAARCYQRDATCPTGQLAIVVNGLIVSTPTVQTVRFEADQIQISGDFTEESAKALAAGIDAAG